MIGWRGSVKQVQASGECMVQTWHEGMEGRHGTARTATPNLTSGHACCIHCYTAALPKTVLRGPKTCLWVDHTRRMASGVPMPAARGSPAGPNLHRRKVPSGVRSSCFKSHIGLPC